ncbi:glyoxalase/bleomycin resistance/extradiol dioxygenase family protein [Gracilibacillus caseinilyticus]|uniref:Glyoxalase/bleomycin resistance/extradiol dioxygenase family protein n=1 Tax=Gracilibacillus caseinilyticus TaxID=2932256 RepID=A0ABY4EXJ9_9BACI|nr:VOC family protein [Gracilibacillus caseinilyticus]UOQ48573.1 glyoxalase/bleomycin resistance/extradiol dioxygenase family protein [Gracilibacillus caseinilyticus]
MTFKSQDFFLNLSVKDINKATHFYKELGFEINPQFSDETTSCVIIGENIFAMIMVEERFKSFTKKEIVDTNIAAEAIFCISTESREQDDEIVNKALSIGGAPYNEAQDHGFVYIWGFEDLDGHLWEVAYMDKSAS